MLNAVSRFSSFTFTSAPAFTRKLRACGLKHALNSGVCPGYFFRFSFASAETGSSSIFINICRR